MTLTELLARDDIPGDAKDAIRTQLRETERLRAELANRERGRHAASEAARVWAWEWSIAEREIYVGPGLAEALGCRPEELGHAPAGWLERVHPEDLEGLIASFRATVERPEHAFRHEFRLLTRGGDALWVASHGTALTGDNGSVAYVAGVAWDISVRRRQDTDLRLHEQILAHLGEGVCLIRHSDLMIVYANGALERMLGYPRGSLVGRPASVLTTGNEREGECEAEAIRAAVQRDGWWTGERPLPRADGTPLWCSVAVSMFHHPEHGDVGVVLQTDISERRRAEEQLRLQALVLDQIQDRVTVTDLDGNITYVNQAEVDCMGYSRERLLSMSVRDYGDDPARGATQQEIIDRTLREGGWTGQVVNRSAAGEEVVLLTRTTLVRDSAGEPVAMCGLGTDITAQIRRDEALRESETRFRGLFEGMSQGVVYHDAEGRVTAANPAAARILGLTLDQLLGRTSLDPRWGAIREDGSELPGEQHPAMIALRTGREVRDVVMGVRVPGEERRRWIVVSALPQPPEAFATFTEVSDLKAAQEELAQALVFTEEVIDCAGCGIVVLDASLVRVGWNRAAEAITGLSAAEALGRPFLEGLSTTAREHSRIQLERALRGEPTESVEAPFRNAATGQDGWAHVTYSPHRDASGEPIGAIVSINDRTEQRRAQSVAESLGSILDSATNEVYVFDAETLRFIHANHGARANTGYTMEELLRLTPPELEPLLAHDELAALLAPLRQGRRRSVRFETEHERKDGSRYPVEVHLQRATYGTTPAFVAVVLDTSERIRAQRELQASEERFRTLFEHMLDAAALHEVIVDAEGTPVDYRFLAVNPSFEAMTGLNAAEVLGRTVREVLPATEETWIRRYGRVALSGEPTRFILAHDGLGRVYQVHAYSPAHGQFVSVFMDITAQEAADRARREFEQQLQRSQRLESIGVLAGGIAHDFNNILAAIMGFAEMALEEHDERDGSSAVAYLHQVLAGAGRAKELVGQILTFTRQAPMSQKALLLGKLVTESLRFVRASLPATVEIETNLDPQTPPVRADATHIHQVLLNLCTNAEYAMRPNGGTLTVTLGSAQVGAEQAQQLGGIAPARYAVLSVSDTGCGMDAATRDRVFEPFYTTKPIGEGTGLGLATCYGIATGHGGTIAVESAPGVGTTFRVYLPAVEEAVGKAHGGDTAPQRGAGRVLFVDDEEALGAVGGSLLRSLGYQPTVLSSGPEALEAIKADPRAFDVVLTDQTMPRMTGIDLVSEIRRLRPDQVVVLMTGFSSAVTADIQQALGIAEVLRKPFTKRELAGCLARALGPAGADADS